MEWRRLLPKMLQVDPAQAHLHVTQCVVEELKALGEPAGEALILARTLPLLKCRGEKHGHGMECTARECALSLVGKENSGKWVVVTQDPALRDALRIIPGVPLCLISSNVLILEPPSTASRFASRVVERSKSKLAPGELAALRTARGGGRAGGGRVMGGGGRGAGPLKKRKGPSEPNPLSRKKRKRGSEGEGAESAQQHCKNRRKKTGGGGVEAPEGEE